MNRSVFITRRRNRSVPLWVESLDRRDCPAVFGNPWPTSNLTLSFVPDGTFVNGAVSQLSTTLAKIPPELREREVLRAFQTWIASANVNVGVVIDNGLPIGTAGAPHADPRFGDVRIAAIPLPTDVVALGLPFDATAGTRAGDVWFNSNLPFNLPSGSGFDLFSVALHEIGHVFGIPGSTDPASVMYQDAVYPRTALSPADSQAMTDLYGNRRPDNYEADAGNETLANAPTIQTGGGHNPPGVIKINADLTTATDVDVFRFKPKDLNGGGMTVSVRVAGYSLISPRVDLLNESGVTVATGVGTKPGAGDVAMHVAQPVEGASYYVRVSAGTDPTFAIGGYHLEVIPDVSDGDDDLDDPEENEDDTPETSDRLEQREFETNHRLDYAVAASLSTPTDVDYYRYRTPHADGNSAGVMTAVVWGTDGTGIDPVLSVFDNDLVPVAFSVIVHDGGSFAVQVPNAESNRDYYLSVKHAHPNSSAAVPGNYSLGIDFGRTAVAIDTYAAGTLTGIVPVHSSPLHISPTQVLHLVLAVGAGQPAAGVRLTVLAADGRTIDTRFALAGEVASMNLLLPAGDYQLFAVAGTTDGSPLQNLTYSIRGSGVSDPIGPKAVLPGQSPPTSPPTPPPPPVISAQPPQPLTPVTPIAPTPPPWLIQPPAAWPVPPGTALHPVSRPLTRTFSAGGADGVVRSFNSDGTERFAVTVFPGFAGLVRVAEADFNGDGVADLIAGTGPGGPTRVRILDGKDRHELLSFPAFEPAFVGGIYVAVGDVTGDGIPDLVVTPDEGGGPRVRVFDGASFVQVDDFFGIDDPNFRGGARAAVGDISGDGVGDLIVAAGFGGGPRVAAFDGRSLGTPTHVKVFGDYFAYEPTLRNGVFVAAGDVTGDGFADLVTGAGPGGAPRTTVFTGSDLRKNTVSRSADFFAGDSSYRGGVRVALKDLDADAFADLVVGAGDGNGTFVQAYFGTALNLPAPPLAAFTFEAFAGFSGGVFVG